MDSTERISHLLFKKFRGELTPEEAAELTQWADRDEAYALLLKRVNHPGQVEDAVEKYRSLPSKQLKDDTRLLQAIEAEEEKERAPRLRKWPMIAAASLLLLATAGLLYRNSLKPSPQLLAEKSIQDFPPGDNKAFLNLPDGRKIDLDAFSTGKQAQLGALHLSKTAKNELRLELQETPEEQIALPYSIETPVGGQYHVRLPDGTAVWLNAQSKLSFTPDLQQKERTFQLEGEAFFDVATQKDRPFLVHVGNQTVAVLGTAFNINAYENEPYIKTTLLNGNVKVSVGSRAALLKPGQQTRVQGNQIDVEQADPAQAMAWKDGFFKFQRNTVEEVMRQVSRWYNVQIRYEDQELPDYQLVGTISRQVSLRQVLKMLEMNRISCSLEGRTIIIRKNNTAHIDN